MSIQLPDNSKLSISKAIVCCLLTFPFISFFVQKSNAQTLRVEGKVTSLNLSDCSDCNSSADPRIKSQVSTTVAPWSGEYTNETDNVGCSGNLTSDPGTYLATGVGLAEEWWVRIRGFESDGFTCSGNDGDCDSYSSISTYPILSGYAPNCNGAYNTGSAQRTCTSGGTQVYTANWRFRYHFEASSLNDANAGGSISLSNASDATICSGSSVGTINGNTLLNNRFNNRQWQVSVNGGSFTDIGGQNGQNFNPGVLNVVGGAVTTYTYRRRLQYCTDFFNGVTSVFSNSITIAVRPNPTATISGTATVCQNATSPQITITNPQSLAVTVTYNINNGANQTVSIGAGTNTTLNVSTATAGTFAYNLVSVSYNTSPNCSQSISGTATVTVRATPTATIAGTTSVCQNGTAPNLTINNPQSLPVTVSYLINGANSTNVNLAAIGSSTVSVPTTTVGAFTYTLNSVAYQSAPTCSNSLNSSATVTVNATPNGSISIPSPICAGNSTNLTFTFSQGTGPFNVVYNNGSTNLNLTGISNGHTVSVTPPVGSTTYSLVSITDANGCSRNSGFVAGTATVVVNSLDNASFSYASSIYCSNSPNPDPVITGTPGGSFSASPGLFINPTTGTVLLASSTTGVTHTITYTTTGVCPVSSNVSLQITPADDASFSYTQASYCINAGGSQVPVISGLGGGSFSATPAGLSLNSATGAVDVANSQAGNYTINYLTNGACPSTGTTAITITSADNSSFSYSSSAYCVNGANPLPTITGLSGGTFSSQPGLSINANSGLINLSTSTVGVPFIITYTTNGPCSSSSTFAVVINAAPVVSFSGLNPSYCANETTPDPLFGSPAGGTFSGMGIVGNDFIASLTTVGNHAITYTYTDANNCTNTSTQSTQTFGLPFVNFSGLSSAYCVSDANPVALTGFPVGGTFSGTGVSGAQFTPSVAGTGLKTVTYTYTDANGCTNSLSQQVLINSLPIVGFAGLNSSYCISSPQANLTGFPTGGTFSGTGVSGTTFDPSAAGIGGPFNIVYSFTDGNGCSNSTSSSTIVNSLPVVSISGLNSAYCSNSASTSVTVSPIGGQLSGPGVAGNTFDPSLSGNGTQNITYVYTDGNGCQNSTSQSVIVNPAPIVSFTGLLPQYCENGIQSNLVGTPTGGTFSGMGINANSFNPQLSGVGTHTITYQFTDVNGCSNSAIQQTIVHATPAVAFTGLQSQYCVSQTTPVLLNGTPAGGTFIIGSVVNTALIPNNQSLGSLNIAYFAANSFGCADTLVQQTTIVAAPTISITGLASQYCTNSNPVILSGTPVGGTFSGQGINVNLFSPASAGLGNVGITYSFDDGNGCSNSLTQNTVINPTPQVTFSGLAPSYCITDSVVTLSGFPSGGVFLGNGALGSTFDPALAGTGNQSISYAITDNNGCTGTTTVNTVVNPLPTVSFSGLSNFYCLNASPSTLVGNPGGGVFSGSGIVNDQFIPSLADTGSHTVLYTFTSIAGCTNSASLNTSVLTLPIVSISGLNSGYCQADPPIVLVGLPGGGQFTGNGVSNGVFTPTNATIGSNSITYTFTDGNGCSGTLSENVTINANPSVPVISPQGPLDICFGTISTLDAGAGAGYSTYTWVDGQNQPVGTSQSIFVNSAGTFSVIVASNQGCESQSLPVTINVIPLPALQLGNDTLICVGGSIVLDAGSGFSTYQWNTGQNSQTINVTGTGLYQVTVSNVNGCQSTDEIVVTQANILNPVITSNGASTSICNGSSVLLSTTLPYQSYLWSDAATTSPTFNATTGGAVSVTVTDVNGCQGTSAPVNINLLPSPLVGITPSGPTEFCLGESVELTATAGLTQYQWNDGVTDAINIASQSGTYTVTAVGSNGCQGSSSPLVIVVNTPPSPTITADGPITFCKGSAVNLTVNPSGQIYLWNTGSTTQSINVSESGSYTVLVQDINGCTDSTFYLSPIDVNVISPLPQISISGNTFTSTNSFVSYQWYRIVGPGSSPIAIPGATNQSYTAQESGIYYLVVTDETGCTGESFEIEHTFVGLEFSNIIDRISLYPNPIVDRLVIDIELSRTIPLSLSLLNTQGQVVLKKEFEPQSQISETIELETLSNGIYLLLIKLQDINYKYKVVKQ